MKRYPYDLDSYIASVGKIGRLQTLQTIPVLAGDSMQIDFTGALRMSPLRRVVSMDAQVKLSAFYVPHRHIYGDDYINWLKAGFDTASAPTLTTYSANLGPGETPEYIPGLASASKINIPACYANGYNNIWDEYWRVPTVDDEPGDVPSDRLGFLSGTESRQFGARVARLPHLFSTGASDIPTTEDIDTSGQLDIKDLSIAKAKYSSTIDREYFAQRYRDLLDKVWGTGMVNTDADQRPTLLGTETKWISGYDVDGTADANLGEYTGKSQVMVNMHLPTKFFQEHGLVWLMAVVRYPSILAQETHNLTNGSQFNSYNAASGDPLASDMSSSQELTMNQLAYTGGSQTVGYHPTYQWFRTQPNAVHPKFIENDDSSGDQLGYPFTDATQFSTSNELKELTYDGYHTPDMYQSTQLAHWNMVGKVNCAAKRVVRPTVSQVYSISNGA